MIAKNYSVVVSSFVLFILLGIGIAGAGIGMSAGPLDFGKVPRAGTATLSYQIVNTGGQPMPIVVEVQGDISKIAVVEPRKTVIPPSTSMPLSVTVYMPKDVEEGTVYEGNIFVKTVNEAAPGGAAGVTLQLGSLKKVSAIAGGEIAPTQPPYILIAVLGIIILVLVLIIPIGFLKRRRR